MSTASQHAIAWDDQTFTTIGPGRTMGDKYFTLGPRPQIKAAHFTPSLREPAALNQGLLTGNAIKDIRLIPDPLAPCPVLQPLVLRNPKPPHDSEPLGYSGSPYVADYRYLAQLPNEQTHRMDLLVSFPLQNKTELLTATSDRLIYQGRTPLLETAGVPDVIRWQRNGPYDLLLATADGRIMRHARLCSQQPGEDIAFDAQAQQVHNTTGPLQFEGLAHLCVVDLYRRGRSDLLIGTAQGLLLLYPDIGDDTQVRLGRAIQLCSSDGFIELEHGASPAVLHQRGQRHLIAADGRGVFHTWPLQDITGKTTHALPHAWTKAGQTITPSALRSEPITLQPPQPELVIDLPAAGWYEVHVTFSLPDEMQVSAFGQCHPMVEARLGDNDQYVCLSPDKIGRAKTEHRPASSRVFFKAANLKANKLHLRQPTAAFEYQGGWPAWLESISLVPIPEPQTTATQNTPTHDQFPIAAILDTFMWFNHIQCDTPKQMDELMGYHQQAGFNTIYYKAGGAGWEYPSNVKGARGGYPDVPEYSDEDKKYCVKTVEMLERVNRVQLAIDACKKRDMTFVSWIRLQNQGEHMSAHARFAVDQFFIDNPQWSEMDIHGRAVRGKLCLAYPEVSAYYSAIAAETVQMGARIVMIDTLRHLPKVMYGEPVLAMFEKAHGLDMRSLPPFDERVVYMQVQVMTDFLREVKAAIRKVRSDAQLHVRVGTAEALMGCDVGLWAREGLIEAALIEFRGIEAGAPDVRGLVKAIGDSGCMPIASFARPVWGIEAQTMHPYRMKQEVADWLAKGARGIAVYESAMTVPYPDLCRSIQRISKPDTRFSCVV